LKNEKKKDMDSFLNKITDQFSKEKKSIEKTYKRKPIKSANSLLKEEFNLHKANLEKKEKSRYRSRSSK
jgi:hypothetical protein